MRQVIMYLYMQLFLLLLQGKTDSEFLLADAFMILQWSDAHFFSTHIFATKNPGKD